jgi:hypothetical protein
MKRYIITTIVPGCEGHVGFLEAIKNYSKRMHAEVVFISTPTLFKKAEIDESILNYGNLIGRDVLLNNNLSLSTLPISPDQPDPISGLGRIHGNERSVIYGSPKQRLKSIASPSSNLPRVVMTPGTCCKPFKGTSKRSIVANLDLVIGAIVVEVTSSKLYHYRQVQASKTGSFVDLGIEYHPSGKTSEAKLAALIPGDWHVGYTDPVVRTCTIEMLKLLKPDYLIMHDLFDGISVNHHIDRKLLMKAMLGAQNSLAGELQATAIELANLQQYPKKQVIVVKSNHDEFLDKWLDEGNYLRDTQNHIVGLELAFAKAQGKDPLQYGISKYQKLSKVKFLQSEDSFKISSKQIECGMHGHLGPNGSRGSASSLELAFLASVSGHTHSPEILRQAYVMGTSSYLKLNYNKGPSSWMQTHCLVYENGARQLINIIKGKWKA